jgi:hypothetical protein
MTQLVPASAIDDLFRQRQLTRDIVKLWFPTAVWGDGKIPIKKITEATGKAVDPIAWATPGSLQSKLNLLGQLTPSTLDIDLDVRLTADPQSRPRSWTEGDKALAEEWFYRPFREELRTLTGDTRNHWGRASMGGTGHWLIKLAPDDELSRDEIRGRLKQLQFSATTGPFTVKLEVRFPTKAAAQLFAVLPGSQYSDGDYVSFFNTPGRPDPHIRDIALQPLCQALYSAALRMVVAPHTQEGDRHSTALLVSGVLRREVEDMEREGGRGFNRDDARRLFEEIFLHDTELKARRKIFEADFAKDDASELPGYTALGKRVGEETAQALSCMLHGYDRGPIDRLRERLVFIHDKDVGVVDLEEMAGGANLEIYPRSSIALIHNETVAQKRGKRVFAFRILETMKSRRHADGWIAAPGCEQGGYLYQGSSGQLLPVRQSERERSLLNLAPGWLTPYVEDAPTEDAQAVLDEMLSWFTANPHHKAKILQAIAFKVQNALVKAQFALAIVGGQGIGKSFFFHVMRTVLGKSVAMSNVEAVYRGQYVFSPAVGASLLIIEEADEIPDFTLAKQLHREAQPDVNLKYASKGPQWCLGVPIYLTNKSNPRLQEEGVPDRTLYIVEAPTQTSLRLTAEEWLAFREKRAREVMAISRRLEDQDLLLGLRRILEEYPVTYSELHDNSKSDSLTEEYRRHDMAPDQLVLQAMLARGYVHSAHPDWAFDAPITKDMFNDGYNMLYRYFVGRGENMKSNQYISRQLVKMLGDLGVMESFTKFKEGRVYYFPAKLGTLRQRFAAVAGAPVPDETPAEEGPNKHSPEDCSRAWAYWKKAGLTDRTDY